MVEAGESASCLDIDNTAICEVNFMKMEDYIRAIAGCVILVTLMLGWLVSPYWYLFTAFVGVNLVQSAFTGLCPMEIILEKIFNVPRKS